ncbi:MULTISPECIES: ABC transporter permease [Clostridia]|uniref:ABC transporter permease n=1 Tax=Clostridia TaxID=186801 RepID=UPI000EA22536|nr:MULTISPECIES: ABC transporter permease [Clostridia]NBJ69527.1 ABC transporter permease [Roseburia sp. 1XD42-34]RKI78599.1 ABC transporter permease [Clostridium sp. 1xD42-85]
MRSILQMELMKNAQDKGLYFWTFLLPIIFTVLFISIFTSGTEGADKEYVIISIVPGYVVMFVFFIMISMGFSFIDDRDKGMVARLASTPLSPYAYLFGKWLPYVLLVFTQIMVLLTFGKVVYNIPIEQPLLLGMLALILTICITGLGLALSLLIRTSNMGVAVTQVIALGGALLGGLWMPLDAMPSLFQKIGKLTPQYWAHNAFQETMTGTLAYNDFFIASLILLTFGAVGFIIAFFAYPSFLNRAKH